MGVGSLIPMWLNTSSGDQKSSGQGEILVGGSSAGPVLELKSKWEELELATLLLSHFSAGEAAPAWLKWSGQREETGNSHF